MASSAFNVLSTVLSDGSANPLDSNVSGSAYSYGIERSILESCREPVYINPNDKPCSHFFQQRGAIDYKSYLRLKQEERLAIMRHHAAVKIQAFWRGFLIRDNWKILEASAIKIQSWVRGHFGRKRFKKMVYDRDARIRKRERERAAIKIQAAWRGYSSRKNKLDFKLYKSIQAKNEALRRSIARINELESVLLKTLQGSSDAGSHSQGSRSGSAESNTASSKTSDPCLELAKVGDERLALFLNNVITPSVETFLVEKIPEYVNELSESRISELYAYLANLEFEMKQEQQLENLVRRRGGINKLTNQELSRLEQSREAQRERANHILDIAKLVMMAPLKNKLDHDRRKEQHLIPDDSVDNMFPTIPDRPDVIQPDPIKVAALKDAIRMFRQQGEAKEDRDLKRKHVLLRTKAQPGVYSDIYTTELTETEQKLKSLKFWRGSLAAEKLANKQKVAQENRLKRLFAHALKIGNKRQPETEEAEEDDEEGETTADEGMPLGFYREYAGEMMPEDGDYDDDDDDDSSSGAYYMSNMDLKPPPPTPNTGNNVDDYGNAMTDEEMGGNSTAAPSERTARL